MFRKIFLIIVIIFSSLSLFFISTNHSPADRKFITATLNKTPLKLELALNREQWFAGLSNRPKLCDNCGMLFIFPKPAIKDFVMRQMNFPLDIIWLNNGSVIGYDENLQPEFEPYTPHESPGLVDAVLEVPTGFVKNYSIKIKDNLLYEKN